MDTEEKIVKRSELRFQVILKSLFPFVFKDKQFYYLIIFFLIKNSLLFIYLSNPNNYGDFALTTIGETVMIYFVLVLYYLGIFYMHKNEILESYKIIEDE
jgi:hypothetical protein